MKFIYRPTSKVSDECDSCGATAAEDLLSLQITGLESGGEVFPEVLNELPQFSFADVGGS